MVSIIEAAQEETMNSKPVQIFKDALSHYITPLEESFRQATEELKTISSTMIPPYPFVDPEDYFHVPESSQICHTALLQLRQDMETINAETWQSYFNEYKAAIDNSIKENDKGKYARAGHRLNSVDVRFNDSMMALSDEVADYIVLRSFPVPYVKVRNGVTSHKVIAGLALIHTGKLLLKRQEEQQTQK